MTEQRESLLQDGRLGEIRLNAFAGQHMRGTKRQLEEDIRYLLHLLKAQDEELRRCMTDELVDDVEQAAREQAEPRKEDTEETKSGLPKHIEEALDLMDKDPKDLPPLQPGPHGKVVERRQEAFHDVIIYEDGYEEFYDIGD